MPKLSAVVRETGVPTRWVRRFARERSGTRGHGDDDPCPSDPCRWCEALLAVLADPAGVRAAQSKLDRNARMERIHERTVASLRWKRENHDLFDFLESMQAGDFRDAALRAVDAGNVSDTMTQAVRDAARRRPVPPPQLGAWFDGLATVTWTEETVDRRGNPLVRVEFVTDDGWRGRVDLSDPPMMRAWRGAREGTTLAVKGRVVWRVDRMAVVDAVGGLSPATR
ncbi:MAG: hypothetical protein EBT79_02500 [Actinobacteria bacterium]|nr:hypothetical protein [Actinomycetota bacterium]NBR66146.1 hypothetical protein [Actinomycetota bacterium]